MLLRSVTFENFGIYGGVHTFDLTPDNTGPFVRPIVLFSGKNGVGKTTFVEGVRLCLHGPLALGSRVSQQEYESWLEQRIHRTSAHHTRHTSAPPETAVELSFDFTAAGRRQCYRVRRAWSVRNRRVQHELLVWEDGVLLDALTPEECETLLRELAPPGLADIFFFDGEKILALAKESTDQTLLADTVNALLGLKLVDQLQRDLDVHLARHSAEGGRNGAHHELEQALAQQQQLEERRADLMAQVRTLEHEHARLRQCIATQEAQIAAEGGSYASRRQELQTRQAHIDAEIEGLRRQAVEMSSGLLPFAFAPDMLRAVQTRLDLERAYHEQTAVREMLARQEQVVLGMIGDEAIWSDETITLEDTQRRRILRDILTSLRNATLGPDIPASEVILHVSDRQRAQLTQWIEHALGEAPLAFSRITQTIGALQTERSAIEADLQRVPADEVLAPLVDELHRLLRQLGGVEQQQAALAEALRSVEISLEQNGYTLRRARAAIEQRESALRRADLAARTQRVLDDYKAALTQRKLALLEQSLVSHFNQLCRKHSFLDRIEVDPATFALTLHRAGHTFSRAHLSAGENQLLAIALLWALRELSGRATPVIIDTPLSRLDSQHRQSMVHDFLPHASHQVIVLATDAEIDAAAQKRLAPAIARIYHMEYDPTTGATAHHVETPQVVTPNLTLFEEQ